MKLRFTFEALTHIDAIGFYLAQRSPAVAAHIVGASSVIATGSPNFQIQAMSVVSAALTEWTVAGLPYIVVHEVNRDENELIIIAVFHGAQRH